MERITEGASYGASCWPSQADHGDLPVIGEEKAKHPPYGEL